LRDLNLNFEFCDKITDKGLDLFRKDLKSLTSLQSVNLGFK